MTRRADSEGDLTPLWSPVSTFVRRKACPECFRGIAAIVAPLSWPIGTIAKVCYACGRVLECVDGLLIMEEREAAVEFQPRPFAVRRGVAIQPSNAEVAREIVLLGLEGGLSAREVAAELKCDEHYVKMIERHAHGG